MRLDLWSRLQGLRGPGFILDRSPCGVAEHGSRAPSVTCSHPPSLRPSRRQKDYILDKPYDVVVIAHNGKCANRLVSTAGVPAVLRQLRTLKLSSIWAGVRREALDLI